MQVDRGRKLCSPGHIVLDDHHYYEEEEGDDDGEEYEEWGSQ